MNGNIIIVRFLDCIQVASKKKDGAGKAES
jgi:hypothetical protein